MVFKQTEKQDRLPMVSIGMPVYNGEEYLRDALDTLLEQTYRDFELIISDNASTDCTANICTEYSKKDKRIKYNRQKKNIGAISNFNYVLSIASGKYFMWAAHDDKWNKNYVELLANVLIDNEKMALAYGMAVFINDKGLICGGAKNNFFSFRLMRIDHNNQNLLNALIYYLDRNPFKIYGLYKTTSIKKYKFEPFLGSAQNAENILLFRYLAANRAIECAGATYFYRKLPKSPESYAEKASFVAPSRLQIEFAFIKEVCRTLWAEWGIFSVIFGPAIPVLFIAAFYKPLLSRIFRVKSLVQEHS